MAISMVRRDEMIFDFKDGFAQTELLPNSLRGSKITNVF